MTTNLIEHFSMIEDPRIVGKCRHNLIDILIITVCAVLCKSDESWEYIEDFGKARINWLKKYLELPNGIPSHDTFRRVFLLIDHESFRVCFYEWAQSMRKKISGETIAIDGKTVRGSLDRAKGIRGVHVLSAWANENHMVLGQIKVHEKSNEITAIPELLDMLDISGCTVTTDAMGAQKAIAEKIIGSDADYALCLKGNHGDLHRNVREYIDDQLDEQITDPSHRSTNTTTTDHGRVEERTYHIFRAIDWLEDRDSWAGLSAIGVVESLVHHNAKTRYERRYFITSLTDIERALERYTRALGNRKFLALGTGCINERRQIDTEERKRSY